MFICEGEIVGMRQYTKDGNTRYYAQVVFVSKINGYTGKRACACPASQAYKIGTKVEIADDFQYPQILER